MIPFQLLTATPVAIWGATTETASAKPSSSLQEAAKTVDPTAGIRINRTVPTVTAPRALAFSIQPKDEEFAGIHVFAEPLVPLAGKKDLAEDKVLADAITGFAQAANPEQTDVLVSFLDRFPESRWRASLLADLGAIYRSSGYWSKALAAWEESWQLLANETAPRTKTMGDYVLGELAQLNARLGRAQRLQHLFAQIANRDVRGPATEKISGARAGLALMETHPERAFRCGPMALERILIATHKPPNGPQKILESQSAQQGMSLVQVNELAKNLGMEMQMAKRSPGARIIYPSVVNWKVGHFAALTKEVNGKFLSQDPTFADDVWVTQKAIDQEASGYFLIPKGDLPAGWQTVSTDEGKNVWGKGNAGANSKPAPPCVSPTTKCSNCQGGTPMAEYNIDSARVSLTISDTPVGYTPPKGPAVRFTVSYQQREVAPVTTPTYSNLGNKWSFNWLAYLVVDPNNPSADAAGYGPGGGVLDYTGFDTNSQTYVPQPQTNISLVKTGPSSYEKRFPDGSKQVFDLPDGANVYPQKIFMRQSIDPSGNALTFTYDGSFRLVAVTDPVGQGQVTTLSYDLPPDPLKITKVTDPFGRTATFDYNGLGQLWKITDEIGIVSEFTYGSGDFITKLTTPYGDTSFAMGESGDSYRWLEVTDPQGATERVEYHNEIPNIPFSDPGNTVPTNIATFNQYMNDRNTFYWDKKEFEEAHGDYTKARITHWLHTLDINVASDIVESVKEPLENRVWYSYSNQPFPGQVGTDNRPRAMARVLDDGSSQLYQYDYNSFGRITKITDPLLRQTTNIYDSSGIDLLEVHQTTNGIDELLAKYTYNDQHLPLTATDASGQTTTFTYSAAGQIQTIENPKHEITTYNYDPDGYLQNIVGAVPGAITSFAYDGFGRLRTTTDSQGYAITVDYDAIGGDPTKTMDRVAKITFPDGTYEQVTYNRLDPEWARDRLGLWSRRFYDALRRVVATQDPLNRFVQYDWCNCGSLEGITDSNNNTTTWIRDIQERVTDKVYPDRTGTHYTYNNTTSRLKAMTDAQGQNTNYSYFIDNNLQQVSYTNAFHPSPGVTYVYDKNYNRPLTMTDGVGVTTYAYNLITATPTLGAGRLASVNGPLPNSAITYGYDELGRVINRAINGADNTESTFYDALGRISGVTNPLGAFGYAYVAQTARLDTVSYPNRQTTKFSYFDNIGDNRLQTIQNLDSSSNMISQFDYAYNAVGQITNWQQNNSGLSAAQTYGLLYDAADQLTGATFTLVGDSTPIQSYAYGYDKVGNRTQEQIGSATTTSDYNNLNQLTGQSAGGLTHFRGTLSEWATVTIGGNPATVDNALNFDGAVNLTIGMNVVPIVAVDASGNTRSNSYQVTMPSGTSKTLTYDLNGNLLNDGSKTYEWDAANRCTAINRGTHRTELSYDRLSREAKRVEKENGTVVSTQQFIWCGFQRCEERDGNNNVAKRFYAQGEQIGGDAYFYNRDHLGSVRELADGTGNIRARYDYDLYGRRSSNSITTNPVEVDFGYTGYYSNAQWTDLAFAPLRVYGPDLGRFISRDPIGENGGLNLYEYAANLPTVFRDPSGENPILLLAIAIYFALDRYANAPTPDGPIYTGAAPNALAFVDGAAAGVSLLRSGARCAAEKAPVIIGENMNRVNAYAGKVGGETIDGWLAGREWTQQLNDEFIVTMKTQGRQIQDIGPDFGRRLQNRIDPSLGRPPSSVYGGERQSLLDYGNYKGLYDRTGTYRGGVPGSDP